MARLACDVTTPYADVLPALSPAEFEALRISIEQEGVREPLVATEDGRLLDGHNRRALDSAAFVITLPGSAGWTDAECTARILRNADGRRNLSPEQAGEVREKKRQTAQTLRAEGRTQVEIAAALGMPRSTVEGWLDTSND